MEAVNETNSAATTKTDLDVRLKQLMQKANQGDTQALAEMRTLLDEHPEVTRHLGDLATMAERVWIDLVAHGNELVRESVRRQIQQLKSELGGEQPMALEKLLVDHVAVCNLAERHAELLAAEDSSSIQVTALRLKRAESAQRRLLSAIKTLALVRSSLSRGLVPSPTLKVFDPSRKVV